MCEGKTLECWGADGLPARGEFRETGHITNYKQPQKQQQFCSFMADHNPSLMMQGWFLFDVLNAVSQAL